MAVQHTVHIGAFSDVPVLEADDRVAVLILIHHARGKRLPIPAISSRYPSERSRIGTKIDPLTLKQMGL